jgi:choline kinase
MRAILLVAGVGRRLGDPSRPKSCLEIGGKTLLARHVEALTKAGATSLTVVVGHLQERVREAIAEAKAPFAVTFRENPDFREGSVVSLFVARDDLSSSEPTIVMDGDVLYDHELLVRLTASADESAFLVDTRSDETGEEMMVGVRGGRALAIARRVGKGDDAGPWDLVGESVGFLKVGPKHAALMRAALEAHVAAGRRNTEYEAVYDVFMKEHAIGVVDVGALPWTEIDFPEDVARARDEILPAIEARR